jgi:uroporphyrinogen-III synthase
MKKVLVTRPGSDAEETEMELLKAGYQVVKDPILAIEPRSWVSPEWEKVDAIIITSKNALAGFAGHAMPKHKPYYVVGERTSQALRKLGLIHITGTVERSDELPALIRLQHKPPNIRFVHLTAAHSHNAFYDVMKTEGYAIDTFVIYEAVAAKELQAETVRALKEKEIDAVTFFSARSAEIFQDHALAAGLGKTLKTLDAICISDFVAGSCDDGLWRSVRAASRPTQKHLLECLAHYVQ